ATLLLYALRTGILEEYRLPAWETRAPRRAAYQSPELIQWINGCPELTDPTHMITGRLLIEHLEQLFCDFRCSERPSAGGVRRMMPTAHGVLSAHAPGLRIYGWCLGASCFVGITGALERQTKDDHQLNNR